MKTMRYRIRVIALALVCALLAVMLWTAKEAWFPADSGTEIPAETETQPGETPSSGPLFDTFGL